MYLKECSYSNGDQFRINAIVADLIVINLQMEPIYHIWFFLEQWKGVWGNEGGCILNMAYLFSSQHISQYNEQEQG